LARDAAAAGGLGRFEKRFRRAPHDQLGLGVDQKIFFFDAEGEIGRHAPRSPSMPPTSSLRRSGTGLDLGETPVNPPLTGSTHQRPCGTLVSAKNMLQ